MIRIYSISRGLILIRVKGFAARHVREFAFGRIQVIHALVRYNVRKHGGLGMGESSHHYHDYCEAVLHVANGDPRSELKGVAIPAGIS